MRLDLVLLGFCLWLFSLSCQSIGGTMLEPAISTLVGSLPPDDNDDDDRLVVDDNEPRSRRIKRQDELLLPPNSKRWHMFGLEIFSGAFLGLAVFLFYTKYYDAENYDNSYTVYVTVDNPITAFHFEGVFESRQEIGSNSKSDDTSSTFVPSLFTVTLVLLILGTLHVLVVLLTKRNSLNRTEDKSRTLNNDDKSNRNKTKTETKPKRKTRRNIEQEEL